MIRTIRCRACDRWFSIRPNDHGPHRCPHCREPIR